MKIIIPTTAQNTYSIDSDFHNRTILAVGKEVIQRLNHLTIGIVCLGGLGIIITELLARLGAEKIIINDFDTVEYPNLNRLTSATWLDAKLKTPKTELAARLIYGINPLAEIQIVNGDFLVKEFQEPLQESDIIFGCSDSVGVRRALNVLCLSRGIPYYDLGCGIKVENGKMTVCGGQVIRIIPGRNYCIECCKLFNLDKGDVDFMSPEEAKRQRDMGYVGGANIPQPSVYALNMMVASQAIWWFLRTMAGEKLDYDGICIDGLTFQTYPWSEKAKRDQCGVNNCPVCGKNGVVFAGDNVDLMVRDTGKMEGIPLNTIDGSETSLWKGILPAEPSKPNAETKQREFIEVNKPKRAKAFVAEEKFCKESSQLEISLNISIMLNQSTPLTF
jgi:molybdopterin/thiamine biosynthesis adenylyltransferase